MKFVSKSILSLVLTLSSCTTVTVPRFEEVRLREETLPPKVAFQEGDEKEISVPLYELKNAIFYYKAYVAALEAHNKRIPLVNENTQRLETTVKDIGIRSLQIQKERDAAYVIAGVLFTGILTAKAIAR